MTDLNLAQVMIKESIAGRQSIFPFKKSRDRIPGIIAEIKKLGYGVSRGRDFIHIVNRIGI